MDGIRRGAKPVIAIDGPAGAGKSTVARGVARRLGLIYIDTGAMYRALTLRAIQTGVDPVDRDGMNSLLEDASVELVATGGGAPRVLLNGEDVTARIRRPDVDAMVARVAAVEEVRKVLVAVQRRLSASGGAVIDGRDTGTHVVPDAEFKFFLTASETARASRRHDQLRRQGVSVPLEEVEQDLSRRDRLDAERAVSPLRPAEDAIIVDSTDLDQDQVVELILAICSGSAAVPSAGGKARIEK